MNPNLLINDEFGCLALPTQIALLLFRLVTTRYDRGILQTSNRGLVDWGRTLGDEVVATEILSQHQRRRHDRLP